MQKTITIILIFIFSFNTYSHNDSIKASNFKFESILTSLPPFLLSNIYKLKEYIRSNEFESIRKKDGDLAAVDSIFQYSLKITNNNIGFSLLVSSIACFDHYTLEIKLPILNLPIPITNESKSEFEKRLKNIPSHFLPDSPKYYYGDKDKLQHIFGSAFLSYAFESSSVTNLYSIFVEKFEDRYIKDGSYDKRDLIANEIGKTFGFSLINNKKTKLSDVIKNYYNKHENNFNNR